MNHFIRPILITMALASLVACATPKEVAARAPVNKTLTVQAGPSVNNYNNSSNPIVIRLYQLNSRSEFETAGFWQIFNGGAPELAGVVVNVRSLSPLYPGEHRLVSIDLEPDVFYLGAFAEFADFGTQQFRHVVPINEELLDDGVTVSVTASGISLQFRGAPGQEKKIVAVEPRKPGFFARLIDGLKS
ncbi:type VI secretion system lipoprotein TssJ [uncultured Planktomarina sp.]|uniref:type VI secretion system lipoprotein TssJ n=1 Tax=uncultured Planktomarina sp. TaxID=1538529 RepID=UPI003261B079